MSDSRSPFSEMGRMLPRPGGPLVLVRVEIVGTASEPAPLAPTKRGRAHHGVESIAREFCAEQPLDWQADSVTLVFAQDGEAAALSAYQAAEAILHRLWIDLGVALRCGVHLGQEEAAGTRRPFARSLLQCLALASAAPDNSVLISDDVLLGLPETHAERFERLGFLEGWEVPVYAYPKASARSARTEAFHQRTELALWDAFRSHAQGPEVRKLGYVGFRMRRKDPLRLDLLDVFIPPKLTAAPSGAYAAPGAAGDREMSEILAEGIRPVVLLGEPGAGKSTLLRRMAISAASGSLGLQRDFGVLERRLPLLAGVGRLAELRRGMEPAAGVERALARYFFERGLADERSLLEFLDARLRAGECLVLLDGLDEVAAHERESVTPWLKELWTRYPQNRFVATTRWVGYLGSPWPGSSEWLVLPFDDAQVEAFARAFVRAFRTWEGVADEDAAGREAQALLDELRRSESMRDLARNPLMLTGMALIFRAEGKLYHHRVQTFDCLATALCETWARVRGSTAGTTASLSYADEALPVLGELARRIHARGATGRAPRSFVLQALADALSSRSDVDAGDAARAAEEFLRVLAEDLQILQELGPDEWGFFHLAFLDFFVAAGLLASEEFEDEALQRVFDPRWQEVLRLGVGYLVLIQKRPKAAVNLIERVLDHASCPDRPWVAECLGKQVVVAALLAAEVGDIVPRGLLERIAGRLVDVLAAAPEEVAREVTVGIRGSTIESEVVGECAERVRSHGAQPLQCLDLLGISRSVRALETTREACRHPEARIRARGVAAYGGVDDSDDHQLTVVLGFLARGIQFRLKNSSPTDDDFNPSEEFVSCLQDPSALVRANVIRSILLNQSSDTGIILRIEEHLNDSDCRVRFLAAVAVLNHSESLDAYNEAARIVYEELIDAEDPALSFESFKVGAWVTCGTPLGQDSELLSFGQWKSKSWPEDLLARLTYLLETLPDWLNSRSRSDDPVNRVSLIPLIQFLLATAPGNMLPKELVTTLRRLACEDPDWHVRMFVISNLGDGLPQPATMLDVMSHAIHDSHGFVRMGALRAIAAFGIVPMVEPVRTLLNDPDAGVADQAANTLAQLADSGVVEYLRVRIFNPSPERRARAAEALGILATEDAERVLLETVRTWQSDLARPFSLPRMSREEGVRFWFADQAGERRAVLQALWSIDSRRASLSSQATPS